MIIGYGNGEGRLIQWSLSGGKFLPFMIVHQDIGPFALKNFFLEPAADASDVNSIREGGEYSLDCSYVLGRFWSWN